MGERIGFLGAGDVHIRAKVDGVWSGYVNSGGCTKFEIKAEAETKEQVDKGKSTYGQKVDAVTIPQNATFAATFTRPAKRVLASLILGTDSVVDVTGDTVTGEAHTAPAIGEAFKLAHRDVTSVAIGSYVADTDFSVDAKTGMVTNLTITAGTALTVNYTYADWSGFQITGMTRAQVTLGFYFDGKNLVDESECVCEVYEVRVKPESAWDFLNDDYSPVELSGTAMTPTGYSAPFTVMVKDLT